MVQSRWHCVFFNITCTESFDSAEDFDSKSFLSGPLVVTAAKEMWAAAPSEAAASWHFHRDRFENEALGSWAGIMTSSLGVAVGSGALGLVLLVEAGHQLTVVVEREAT